MTAERIGCCVPFCRRTRRNPDGCNEWICGPHWKVVPVRLRKRKYRLFRRYTREFGDNHFFKYPAGSPKRIRAVKLNRLCDKAWTRCKQAAIELAMGI